MKGTRGGRVEGGRDEKDEEGGGTAASELLTMYEPSLRFSGYQQFFVPGPVVSNYDKYCAADVQLAGVPTYTTHTPPSTNSKVSSHCNFRAKCIFLPHFLLSLLSNPIFVFRQSSKNGLLMSVNKFNV